MTRDEAIQILRRFQEPEAWEPQITGEAFEALEMAIAALEAQETDLPISPLLKEKQGKKPMKLSTVCLLCKKPAVTFSTDDDIPYTNYSYCEDCLRKGLKLLKAQDADGDTISRRAAIDAILAVTGNSSVRELYEHVQEHGLSEMWSGGVNAAIDIIIALPSAQPEIEERKQESAQNVPKEDLISRKATIDVVKNTDVMVAFTDGISAEDAADLAIRATKTSVIDSIEDMVAKDTNVPINDCISRQAAINAINHICPVDTEYDCTLLDRVDVRCVLSDLPPAQPEIIRCRECIAYQEGIDIDGKPFTRCNGSVRTYGHTLPDWYCGDGKRRTDG